MLVASLGRSALRWTAHFMTSNGPKRRYVVVSKIKFSPARHFGVSETVGKDPIKTSDETEELDVNKWKSVMRSQALFQKHQVSNDDEVSDGEDSKDTDTLSLEATREMVSMWRQAGKLVPEEMTEEEVKTLADLNTKSSRKKYLKYLAIRENHKKARKEKQERKKAVREVFLKEKQEENEGVLKPKNTLILTYWDRSLDKLLAWRSAQSLIFGQPLVFDMSYESNMSRREIENTVSQLLEVEGFNRRATEPFHLHFCNLQPDGPYKQELLKRYGTKTWDRLFITTTERHHFEIFPKEQLVYLTADSPNVLRTFDHSKVYIIGALVDRSIQSGLSLANAKRLKLATARLPLDEFLHWDVGAKNLTLDQMIRIMLTIKDTGKWEEALKFVPKRKHDGFHQQRTQTEVTNNRKRGLTNHELNQHDDEPLRREVRNNRNQWFSHQRSGRDFETSVKDRTAGLGSVRKNIPAVTKTRTSFKSEVEARNKANKQKIQ